jgi:hypothetical protein
MRHVDLPGTDVYRHGFMTNTEMNRLRCIGEMLYGSHWRRPLGQALRVSHTTIGRWSRGERVDPVIWPKLLPLLIGKEQACARTRLEFEQWLEKTGGLQEELF